MQHADGEILAARDDSERRSPTPFAWPTMLRIPTGDQALMSGEVP